MKPEDYAHLFSLTLDACAGDPLDTENFLVQGEGVSDLFSVFGVILYGRSVARRSPRAKFRNIE